LALLDRDIFAKKILTNDAFSKFQHHLDDARESLKGLDTTEISEMIKKLNKEILPAIHQSRDQRKKPIETNLLE